MKYLFALIILIGVLPSALQAVEESHFVGVEIQDDTLTFADKGIIYRGPTEIGFFGIGWYERFEAAKDGKYFVMDDRGRIGDRSKIDTSIYPNGALSFALGANGEGLQKTTFKLPSVTKFPTAEDLEFYKHPFIKSDYKKVYAALSMAEYYRVPSKQMDLVAFKDAMIEEILVGIVNKKSVILIVKSDGHVFYFLKV